MPPFGVRCAAVVAATVLLLGPALALAADRALVISNPATLPDDQAAFVAAAHRELVESYVAAGYETTEGIDLRRDEFARILGLFEGSARSADRIVIHFVGAAVSVSEATGLIPVGASVDTRTAAVFETVPLSLLMDIAALRPNASVVALAIPPYPPTEAAGFANASHLYQVPEGVLVVRGEARAVFAVVTEQMLSQALPINRIPDAGNGVRFEGAVTSSLSLGPAPGSDAASISASTSAQDDDSDLVEQALWELANRSQNPAIAEAYLQRYPAGRFADEARALAERAPENQTPEARETSLDLSATARRRIQQDLTDLGFDTRGVDGVFGPGTRQAIRAWQRSANFSPTGYLTRRQITVMERDAVARSADLREQALRVEQEERQADTSYWRETGATGQEADLRRYLDRYPKGIYSARARDDLEQLRLRAEHEKLELERSAWIVAEELDTLRGYRAFLESYPSGVFAEQAQERIQSLRQAAADNSRIEQYLQDELELGLNTSSAAVLQRRLSALGYDIGLVDGKIDRRTRSAIAQFQQREGLSVTGYLDPTTIQRLIIATSG